MVGAISDSTNTCLDTFNEFIEDLKRIHILNKLGVKGLVLGAWEDELGRLRIWAANIGAHQTGQSSLDFRLRDASHIREQIVKLLQSLLRKIQDARDALIKNEGETLVASPVQLDDVVGGDEDDDVENDSEDDGPGRSDDNEELMDDLVDQDEPETEIQELQGSLATTINCLFEMSILARKPASHDIYIGSKQADVAAFEPSDYKYVKGKYPGADDALVTRLGNAITRRRKYLTLRKWRAIQLRHGTGNVSLYERDFADSQDHDAWDKDIPHFSTRSILPTGNKFGVPPPPESSSAGAPIECPYCFYPINVHGSRSWAEHVFQDLQPYICIAQTCSSPDKLYSTRHEWLHHSKMIHPAGNIAESKSETNTGFVACPLCKEKLESGKQYDRHITRHLQDLALVLLPNSERSSDIEDYQDSDSVSSAESIDITTSDGRLKPLQSLPGSPVKQSANIKNVFSSYPKQAQDDVEEKSRKVAQINTLGAPTIKRLGAPRQQRREALLSMANLALLCLGARGRSEEVMKLREQVMADEKDLLGSRYSDTLIKMANLASLCLEEGSKPRDQRAEATVLQKQPVTDKKGLVGLDFFNTLTKMTNLASVCSEDGFGSRHEEELELRRQVLAARKEVLGLHDPQTLASMIDLASSYQANGYVEEAVTEYKNALLAIIIRLGLDHRSIVDTDHGSGTYYEKQGNMTDA